jgi:di/tricarboxylate transporter
MALSTGAVVVFALIAVAVALFVSELIPPDMTAVAVLVILAVLEPYTNVTAADAIAGFASPAVVTIIAMYILSRGVQTAGVVDWLGAHLARFTRGSERRLLGATTGATGLFAGLVNNTPVVAVFIPMVTDLADDSGVSPSKFLMPLSFAAMLGGTLTLVGSSINLLASDVAARTLDHPIGMFEFTPLGLLVFAVGFGYLLTVGYRLTPPRREPAADLTAAYELVGISRRFACARTHRSSGGPQPTCFSMPTSIWTSTSSRSNASRLWSQRRQTPPRGSRPERSPIHTSREAASQSRPGTC